MEDCSVDLRFCSGSFAFADLGNFFLILGQATHHPDGTFFARKEESGLMQLFSVRNLSMNGLMMLLPMRMAFLHLRRKKDRQFWSFNTMGINQREHTETQSVGGKPLS